MFFKNKFVNAF